MKNWKIIALVVALVMALALFAACATTPDPAQSQEAEKASNDANQADGGASDGVKQYDKKLGFLQPGPETYYQNFANCTKQAAEYVGMEVEILLAEYSAEKEISNVEDFISKEVDVIAGTSVGSDTAQQCAQLCNEANIPLYLQNCAASEGPGKVTCEVGSSFLQMGQVAGEWLANNLEGPGNVVEIQGQLGQKVVEQTSEGFQEKISETRDDIKVVYQKSSNWARAEAIAITEDVISSGIDFNVIFVHNEDTATGVISVLEDNDMLDQVTVISQNGSDDGIKMIKEGKLAATVANPPSYISGDMMVMILKYFDGEDVPATYESPAFIIDSTNVNNDDLVTWDPVWAQSRVDAYFAGNF